MNLSQFINERKHHWDRLAGLVERVYQRGARSVAADQLNEMIYLYREATADLARLKAGRARSAVASR